MFQDFLDPISGTLNSKSGTNVASGYLENSILVRTDGLAGVHSISLAPDPHALIQGMSGLTVRVTVQVLRSVAQFQIMRAFTTL